jgi:hypothetical protein
MPSTSTATTVVARTRVRALATSLALCGLLFALPARGQSALDLAWTAPTGCPDRAEVLAHVHRLVPAAPPTSLAVKASVRQADQGFRVDLEMQGAASGGRTLRASTCASVARATALVIALALDPSASLEPEDDPPPPQPAIPPPRPEPPPRPTRPPTSPVPTGPDRDGLHPLLFATVGAERALLPGVAPNVALGFGVTFGPVRTDLGLRITPTRSTSLTNVPGAGISVGAMDLALRACGRLVDRSIALHGCAAARAVRFSGEAFGVTESYRERAYTLAIEPGFVARFPARSRFGLELDLALVVPVTRPDFVVTRLGADISAFRVSALGGRAGIGASVRF